MSTKILIIEDEELAQKKLVRQLENINFSFEVVSTLSSVEEAINFLHKKQVVDLIFMDVQLEDGICFEIFNNIEISTPVIFTTAYDKYALRAFRLNSIDYLLKPFTEEDLQYSLQKYDRLYTLADYKKKFNELAKVEQTKKKERFLIKVGERFISVPVKDINYFYILDRCNFINTNENKNYPIDYSLEQVEQMLNDEQFFRVNRNCIVNINAINEIMAYSNSRLKLELINWNDSNEILVSRERVNDFKKWMDR